MVSVYELGPVSREARRLFEASPELVYDHATVEDIPSPVISMCNYPMGVHEREQSFIGQAD